MNELPAKTARVLFDDSERIRSSIQDEIRRVVLRHARLGHPVAESRNGRVVWVDPKEVLAGYESIIAK